MIKVDKLYLQRLSELGSFLENKDYNTPEKFDVFYNELLNILKHTDRYLKNEAYQVPNTNKIGLANEKTRQELVDLLKNTELSEFDDMKVCAELFVKYNTICVTEGVTELFKTLSEEQILEMYHEINGA